MCVRKTFKQPLEQKRRSEITLSEDEITDVSLATFHVFDNDGIFRNLASRACGQGGCGPGGCRCGHGCGCHQPIRRPA
jgi:hypothetical protein